MAKKKLKSDGIYFTGMSSEDVTGSQYYIKYGNCKILIECGLHQSASNDYLDSYKINSQKYKFRPSELDYVFIGHCHIDHTGNIGRLVKQGFRGRIITTSQTAKIMKSLLLNSSMIVQNEAKILSLKYKRNYSPLYTDEDIYNAFELIDTYDGYNTIYTLNDNISFRWFKNSHCIGAAQLQLILKDDCGKIKKILYTSDIGALHTDNHYVPDTEIPECFSDVTIMESTYGNEKRKNNKTRSFDINHLCTAIDTVADRKGTIIMPCFSFSRTQEILTTLYDMYGHYEEIFDIPIYVDSQLSCEISKLYNHILTGENLEKWQKVCNWRNVKFVDDKELSKTIIAKKSTKIVLSSSGFCTNGRIIGWLRKYIADENSMVIFSGYVGDNPSYLSYRIKNYRDHKQIKINGEMINNKADCICLSTFSSHAGFDDLIKYGSSLNTNKVILVHGSKDAKSCLAKKMAEAVSKNDKTYKIVESHKDMIIRL